MGRFNLTYNLQYLSLIVFLVSLLAFGWAFFGNQNPSKQQAQKQPTQQTKITAFNDGTYDASGLVDVAGTDGVLFVDNKRSGQVLWMRLDQNGRQAEAVKALDLGVNAEDLEALTADGTHFYTVSSQSKAKAASGAGLIRFKFDDSRRSVSEVESIGGLKQFLVENVAELREQGDRKGKDGGINIEGLAWDARNKRFLVGLRSPVIDGNALVIPLRFRDPQGAFSISNLEVEGARAIRLPLGGVGIRGIEYDKRTNNYQMISGAAEDQDQTDFGIWEWNGDIQKPAVREINRFDKSLKPEGVARVTVGERDFTFVVFDASGYTTID